MKFFIIKKKTILLALALIFIAGLLLVIFSANESAASVYFGISTKKLPIHNVRTEEKSIALTFDAAYGDDKTEEIIKLLKEYDADATFFLVGLWVENFPEKTQSIVDAGFEIGSHSNTHPHMSRLAADDISNELKASKEKIEFYTKTPVTLFRPPFGEYSDKVITSADSLGLFSVQWDIDSYDWKNIPATSIIQRVTTKAKPGSIVLMHNNSDYILNVLPVVLQILKERGYTFKRVSDLIYKENYKIDNNGTQYINS